MNRHQRRALKLHKIPDSVTLVGGPMDGWVVKTDAPALSPMWHTTWPPMVASHWAPGTYGVAVPDDLGVKRATWVTYADRG